MENTYFHPDNYRSDKHWHIEYYQDGNVIEGISFQRREDDTWDVFFNDFMDELEFRLLFIENIHLDEHFGIFLFNAKENEVNEKFNNWISNVLLPIRQK